MRRITPQHPTAGPALDRERSALLDLENDCVDARTDPLVTAGDLAETLVPRWADYAAVQLLDDVWGGDGGGEQAARTTPPGTVLHRVVVAHRDGHIRPSAHLPPGQILRLPAQSQVLTALSNGEIVSIPHADSFTANHLAVQLGNPKWGVYLRDSSILLVPLMAGGRMLGSVMLVREPAQPAFDDGAIETSVAVARWASLCLDHVRSHDRQVRLTDELRQGLWPDQPPQLTTVDLSYGYLPACRTACVGGDWYDVIALSGGRVAFVLGDVMGHGVNAAIVMNRCKTIVHTLALLGLPPHQMLGRFDELTCLHGDEYVVTCLIVIYDPVTRQCHAARAGQIPPILIHPDGHGEVLDTPTGALIGVGEAVFETHSFTVTDGSVLALCTDGLTALHDRDIDRALASLCAALSGPERSLDEIRDGVFLKLATETRKDDVTLLLTRLLGGPAHDGSGEPG